MSPFSGLIFLAVIAVVFVIVAAVVYTVIVGGYGREKVVVGKFHFIEETAGVIFTGRTALFVGNTEVIRGDYYLNIAEKSDY